MRRWAQFMLFAGALAALIACRCSVGPLANGGVSETTNGVTACILYPGGKAAANSIVRLRPHDYLAPLPGAQGAPNDTGMLKIDSLTDSQGRFHLLGTRPGAYVIEVVDTLGNAIALAAVVVNADSLVNLGTDTIRQSGAVSGTIVNAPQGPAFVQVRGLEYAAVVNSETSDFICTGLPPGTFDFRIVSSVSDSLSAVVPQVLVKSDDTTEIGPVSLGLIASPTALSYKHNPVGYVTGAAIMPDTAVTTGTTVVDSFTVAPALPTGISLDKTTGLMTGTPTAASGATIYTVTARNLAGSATVALTITVAAALPPGQYAKHIVLNTAQSGAGVSETVTGFPVLIRLTSASLDFSQTARNGADLYFVRSGTTSLPYEIEQWDSIGQSALVWVKVDTIYGNNDTQSVLMVWGNPGTLTHSSGVVFDTAQGFQGVWHLNEAGDAPCLDATQNHYTGTAYGMSAQSSVPAAIGLGREFDGSTSWFQMHGTAAGRLNFPESGNYTISAWALLDASDTGSQVIASKGYRQYFLKASPDSLGQRYSWDFSEYESIGGWQHTKAGAQLSSWTYVVAQRQGNGQHIYVNGQVADSAIVSVADTAPRDTGNDFTIGRYIQAITTGSSEGFGYFKGSIDEVCVSSVARNPAWIRLCYMNQGATDALVRLK
jgi:hypothetical protein